MMNGESFVEAGYCVKEKIQPEFRENFAANGLSEKEITQSDFRGNILANRLCEKEKIQPEFRESFVESRLCEIEAAIGKRLCESVYVLFGGQSFHKGVRQLCLWGKEAGYMNERRRGLCCEEQASQLFEQRLQMEMPGDAGGFLDDPEEPVQEYIIAWPKAASEKTCKLITRAELPMEQVKALFSQLRANFAAQKWEAYTCLFTFICRAPDASHELLTYAFAKSGMPGARLLSDSMWQENYSRIHLGDHVYVDLNRALEQWQAQKQRPWRWEADEADLEKERAEKERWLKAQNEREKEIRQAYAALEKQLYEQKKQALEEEYKNKLSALNIEKRQLRELKDSLLADKLAFMQRSYAEAAKPRKSLFKRLMSFFI